MEPTEVPSEVPAGVLAELRTMGLDLPETYEEPAWVGTRWRIRKPKKLQFLVDRPEPA